MPSLALDSLLAPIAGDDPCGVELEYDPAFMDLERIAKGKPEQQIGSTIVPAEDPDWKAVQRGSIELLARSKNLRLGVHLAKALLRTSGWSGFSQGLTVLRNLVDEHWSGIYPRLDEGDDDPAAMRVSALNDLTDAVTVAAVRTTPLLASRTLGRFSLKDLEIASGDAPPPATGEAPTMASLDGAALDADLATLQETAAAVSACVESLAALEASISNHVGAADGVNYAAKLLPMVRKANNFLSAKVALRNPSATGVGSVDETTNGNGGNAGGSMGSVRRGGIAGEIASREDVVAALDRISAYYDRHEPSSPIPLFMARCKRLVMMNFIDIVRELVPEAVTQVEVLKGRTE